MPVNGKITISELSRLIDISRPTLYKYVEEYEKGNYSNIPTELYKLFEFINQDDVNDKSLIIGYCIDTYKKTSEHSVLDKIKMLMKTDGNFKRLLIEFVDEYCKKK